VTGRSWPDDRDRAIADRAIAEEGSYLPAARRCQRVRFSIFLCFFLRMRLRRFLMREPMTWVTLAAPGGWVVRATRIMGRNELL